MPESTILILLLCLHLAGCAALYLTIRLQLIRARGYMLPLALFVPLWGGLCILLYHFLHTARLVGGADAKQREMQGGEEGEPGLMTEEMNLQKSAVPLQEALVLNDAGLRRSMMLDVLYENPEDYYPLLNEAIANEDGEVVHYATTAMAELTREYDFTLQQLERAYSAQPEQRELLCRYCDFLGEYLEMHLAQGQMEQVQRRQYARLLSKRLEWEPTLENHALLADQQIRLGESALAEMTLEKMEGQWPREERTLMTRLEYAAGQGDGVQVRAVVEKIERGEIYLSAESRKRLDFFAGRGAAREKGAETA